MQIIEIFANRRSGHHFFISKIINGQFFQEDKFILEINSDILKRYKSEIIQ